MIQKKKEVRVRILYGEAQNCVAEDFTIQDSEEAERCVYDNRKIMVEEIEK